MSEHDEQITPMTLEQAIVRLQQIKEQAAGKDLGEWIYLAIGNRVVQSMELKPDGSGFNNFDVEITTVPRWS